MRQLLKYVVDCALPDIEDDGTAVNCHDQPRDAFGLYPAGSRLFEGDVTVFLH